MSDKELKDFDEGAPESLEIVIRSGDNEDSEWDNILAMEKEFNTGALGYGAYKRICNPENGEEYQVSCNIVKLGSKPDKFA